MKRSLAFSTLLAITLVACGGGSSSGDDDDDDDNHGNLNGPVSGTVGGQSWASLPASTFLTYTPASHTYSITAGSVLASMTTASAMAMIFTDIQAPGTFALGPGLPFRYADVVVGTTVWETSVITASSGNVVIEIATATRLKGHMTYTGTPTAGSGVSGTKVVNVTFDLTVNTTN